MREVAIRKLLHQSNESREVVERLIDQGSSFNLR